MVGYITRGRGVSIHRDDCPNLLSLPDPERRVEIEWAAEKGNRFMVRVFMRGEDRRGLLTDIARAITESGTDIQHADMDTVDGEMHGQFVVQVEDLPHLKKVLTAVHRVQGVLSVERRESFQSSDFDT